MKLIIHKKSLKRLLLLLLVVFCCFFAAKTVNAASELPIPTVDISIGSAESPEETNRAIQILVVMSLIALSPYLLLCLTSFARIIISLHFLRAAMGTQQMPPNQILIGLALFLTFFLMGPTLTQIQTDVYEPYTRGEITQAQAIEQAMDPIRGFMIRQVVSKDLDLFSELAGISPYETFEQMEEELPNSVLIPAFLLGEITNGFKIGVILYIPFIVIDMVVASTLMAMGMMMLPPAMISLPFKILFFVMVDGWQLVIQGILLTFN